MTKECLKVNECSIDLTNAASLAKQARSCHRFDGKANRAHPRPTLLACSQHEMVSTAQPSTVVAWRSVLSFCFLRMRDVKDVLFARSRAEAD